MQSSFITKGLGVSMLMSLAMLAAGCATAGDEASAGANQSATRNGHRIYTGKFDIVAKKESESDSALKSAESDGAKLGTLGEHDVVAGDGDNGFIAFVQVENGRNYVIENRIYVKCSRKNPCALAESENVTRVGERFFEVRVSDYQAWQEQMKTLPEIPGVLEVMPSYSYGTRTDYK